MFQAIEKYAIIGGIGLICVLGIALKFTYADLKSVKEENLSLTAQLESYKAQADRLNSQINAYNESDKKSNQTIFKLRQEVTKYKEAKKDEEAKCNCYDLPIPDAVLQLLNDETSRTTQTTSKANS